jgi:N-acetyl-gamma-glutamyl-phosphate/LysW-gamma-L-alpha-aminoadipyl-6-phosphate reductase
VETSTVRVAVVGASGYVGGELLRLLLAHPAAEVVAATSTRSAGRPVHSLHPNLRGVTELRFCEPAAAVAAGADVTFLAVGRTVALDLVPGLLGSTKCLIDLSPDFRLRDPAEFQRHYGMPHPASELLPTFVPGLPELHREALAGADRISVGGCMATAAILALHPLAEAGLVDGEVVVDGRIGSSGSGSAADGFNLHAERSGAMRVFAPADHRHGPEVAQATGLRVRMTATGVEAVRGAQVLCHVPVRRPVQEVELRRVYRERYAAEPFVRVVAQRRGLYRLPEPKILSGTNLCDVGFAVDAAGRTVTAIAALDNLVKGAAGTAVQCMNVRMGSPERLGLDFTGLHPS